MRHPTSRPAPLGGELDPSALAEAAREVAAALPRLAQKAEAGGLAIVAQHLRKALELAERVAASGSPAQDH